MVYALLSRFRGALMGSALGVLYPNEVTTASAQLQTIVHTTQSLIQAIPSAGVMEGAEAIMASVPLALYLHDNPQKLARVIRETMPPAVQNECQGVASGLAVALTTQMSPLCSSQLVPMVPDGPLAQKLGQVQAMLSRRESLAIALQMLEPVPDIEPQMSRQRDLPTSITLAFYCWLSTAEQFQLSLLRAQQIPHVDPLTLLLTGAFSGAFNGETSIPSNWLEDQDISHGKDFSQLQMLADQLFAAWSGCYQIEAPDAAKVETQKSSQLAAVAAPGLLRPR